MARGVNRNWLNAAGHPHAGLAQDRQRGDAASGQMNDCTAPLSEQRWRQASCIERAAAASYHRRMTIAVKIMGLLLSFVARLITGAQGHWKGCPPKAQQRIYFANHQSHLDWVLIWAALPRDLRAQHPADRRARLLDRRRFKHWITREVFNAVYVSRAAHRRPGPAGAAGRGAAQRRLAGDLSRRHAQQQGRAAALQERAVPPGRAVPAACS